MSNMETVRKLVCESDKAAREAAAIIKDAHYKALSEAKSLLRSVQDRISPEDRKSRLLAMLKDAATNSGLSEAAAANVIAQYPEMAMPESSSINARRDGIQLICSIIGRTTYWPPEQRLKAIHALVLGLNGLADTGLINFPKNPQNQLSLDDLESLARIAAPDPFSSYQAEMETLEAARLEANQIVIALDRGTPKIYITSLCNDPGKEVCATIRNNMADLGVAGMRIPGGGSVSTLNIKDFVKLQDDPIFSSYCTSGAITLEPVDNMVQQL